MVDKKLGHLVKQFQTSAVDGNINISMNLLPSFDYKDNYPFILVRNHEGFSILNLKTDSV